jgi:NADPH:quinone reductase-like Zn-dependent oxidoreductase
MRNVAVCGNLIRNVFPQNDSFATITMHGLAVTFGVIDTKEPAFDRNAPEHVEKVLVKVRAFSCNFRDKSLIFEAATRGPRKSFYVLGSEFCGEVIETGAGVTALHPGDRVIGNGQYPRTGITGARSGLPTNHGSKEYQVFHQAKLLKIPANMPDSDAAAFPIGAQTTYSMIRKLGLEPGERVLVTAAKSNTSLFAVNALHRHDVQVYASTTSTAFADELTKMGVREVFRIDPACTHFLEHDGIRDLCTETGGFDAVIDPFSDLHLGKAVPAMAYGGRYVTCGYYDQYASMVGEQFTPAGLAWNDIMDFVRSNNLHIIGNCLGETDDLIRALQDYEAGRLAVVIDSLHGQRQVGAFFDRTYNAPDRFGKAVYCYE